MRLDIDEREKWSVEECRISSDCKIYLDGIEKKYCTIADEEAGYIVRFATDENGIILRDPDNSIEYKRVREEGKVSITSPFRVMKRPM